MKRPTLHLLLVSICSGLCFTCFSQFKIDKLKGHTTGAVKVLQTFTLTDDDVENFSKESVRWMDENNPVAADNSPYTLQLNKLVTKHLNEDGLELNFKVYEVKDVNAFATADGSVRVFAGLMDIMTDQEILGIIGHEIGHVKNKDAKDAIKTAYLASAAHDVAAAQGGTVSALSNSELGDLAVAFINSQFSKDQEATADEYGFNFLKRNQYHPAAMASAFRKLQKLEEGAGSATSKKIQLFSSHPGNGKRAEKMEKKARELE